MFTQLKHFERKNELLQKRFVFDETGSTPEAPGNTPEASRETLDRQSVPQLNERLTALRADLLQKVERAQGLVRELEGKNEEQQSALAEQIRTILQTIETSSARTEISAEINEKTYLLRVEVAKRMKSIFEKISWSMPSIEGVQAAFEGGATFTNVMRSGPLLMTHFRNLLYVFGLSQSRPEAVRNTPQTPPEGQQTPERIQLPESTRGLQKTEINENAQGTPNNYITFTVTVAEGVTAQYRVTYDGNTIETPEGGVVSEQVKNTLQLPKYLKEHQETTNTLFQKFGIGQQDIQQKVNLIKALVRAQKHENRLNENAQDIMSLLVQKWPQYETSELSAASPSVVLNQILNGQPNQNIPIIEAFKNLPSQ